MQWGRQKVGGVYPNMQWGKQRGGGVSCVHFYERLIMSIKLYVCVRVSACHCEFIMKVYFCISDMCMYGCFSPMV